MSHRHLCTCDKCTMPKSYLSARVCNSWTEHLFSTTSCASYRLLSAGATELLSCWMMKHETMFTLEQLADIICYYGLIYRHVFVQLTLGAKVPWNNMKLVHWPLMGGLLHLVQRAGDWAGPQLRCTKCNSPPRPVYQSPCCCIMVRFSAFLCPLVG